jgi:hypothetical protein
MKINAVEAKRLYESGLNTPQLAARYAASHQCVRKALLKAGCKMRAPRRGSVSPYDHLRSAVILTFRSGSSAGEAGRIHGVPRSIAQRFVYAVEPVAHPRFLPATVTVPGDVAVIAYTAGMLDGEGHIASGAVSKQRYRIAIYSTDSEVIHWLRDRWGGGLVRCSQRKNGWLPIWQWQLWRLADVCRVLSATRPYMQIIRKQKIADEILSEAGRLLDSGMPEIAR